ncbi:phosphatase PAP2 family protein [Streptomyces sp. NPDC051322]|uniref:phosphatase PAP2 family protein n=1 Tax=Streptomyces sp. NPDC051322 TaxID=3154645 RepID=UPI00344F492B
MPYTATRDRPRWWTELLVIAVVYTAYSSGRLLARGNTESAIDHGLSILHLEKTLHFNLERPLNRLFTDTPALGIPADFAYASLHYLVTPAILIWLFRRRPVQYRLARTWLLISTMLGLIGFTLLPTCPPRLLAPAEGFVDTMAQYSSYGWWGDDASAPRGLGGMTNQFAAMPSLHVGWALWCGVMLWRYGRTPLTRILAVLYPLTITFVVIGTANHYLLDAVAGAAVMGVGLVLAGRALRLTDRVRERFASGDPGARSPIVSGGWKTSTGEHFPGQRISSAPSPGTADPAGDGAPSAAR